MGFTSAFKALAHGTLNWDTQLDTDMGALEGLLTAGTNVNGTDWNNVTDQGTYAGSTMANSPDGTASSFTVYVARRGPNYCSQIAVRNDPPASTTFVRTQNNGTWTAWRRLIDSTMDTGWVTSGTGISGASGFTVSSSRYRSINGVVSIGANVTVTRAAMTANASGVITNTAMINLPAALIPATSNGSIQSVGGSSTVFAIGYVSQTGAIQLTGSGPSVTIPTGATLDLMGTYLL